LFSAQADFGKGIGRIFNFCSTCHLFKGRNMILKLLAAFIVFSASALEFSESFTVGGSDAVLKNWQIECGNWKLTEEGLNGTSGGGDGLIFYKNQQFRNFVMECNVRVENREGSLVFRASDKQNLYLLVFNPKTDKDSQGSVLVVRRVNGKETYFAGTELKIPRKEWIKLKVVCEDSNIQIYVNDKFTLSVDDENLKTGAVGLRVYGDFLNGCNASFKDFSVKPK